MTQGTERVTTEDVVNAYRMFLGREPENKKVVEDRVASGIDIYTLGRIFSQSHEFLDRCKMNNPAMSGREPHLQIQEDADRAQMDALFQYTQRVWEKLGRQQPHWSVLSVDAFRKDKLTDQDVEDFFATGESSVEVLMNSLARNHIDVERLQSCLEVGCGLGRVTRHLANQFSSVSACDISESHLEAARFNVSGISDNIDYWRLETIGDISQHGKFDVVYTIIVLQHNPPPVILAMIHHICDAVADMGIAFFQVPTYISGYDFKIDDYMTKKTEFIEMHCVHQSSVIQVCERSGCRVLEVLEDGHTGYKEGERSNTFIVQRAN